MNDPDFSKICLIWPERWRLFCMRIKRRVKERFLGRYLRRLYQLDFIAPNHTAEKDPLGAPIPDGTWSLTDTYRRYCVCLRREQLTGPLWRALMTAVISAAVSALVAWLTVHLSQK